MSQHDIFLTMGIILAGFFILAKSSDLILYSLSDYAKRLGISAHLIGFTAISIASILPELTASLIGAMLNQGEVVFGTVLGSNIFKIPLFGIILFIVKKVKSDVNSIGNAPILTLFLSILPFLLVIDNNLSRADGSILIIAYIIYLYSFLRSYSLGVIKKKVKLATVYRDILIFLGALLALLLSARFLILHTISIANLFNLSTYFVVLVIIGAATSIPELMLQLRAVIKHKEKLAFGYILGAIVANSTLVLGVTAFLRPVYIDFSILIIIGIFLVVGTILSIIYLNKEELNWKHGVMFILFYIVFLISEIIFSK